MLSCAHASTTDNVQASDDCGQPCTGILLHSAPTQKTALFLHPVAALSVGQSATSLMFVVHSLSQGTAQPIVTCVFVIALRPRMCSAGHTWVLLATQVRRSSQHGPLYYRIQRPQNITSPDMQENGLLGVRSCTCCTGRWVFCLSCLSVLCSAVVLFWHMYYILHSLCSLKQLSENSMISNHTCRNSPCTSLWMSFAGL